MSHRLASRIDRVMKELKRKHPCRLCGGKGKHVVSYTHEGAEVPTPEGCPECGELSHIILDYVRVAVIER